MVVVINLAAGACMLSCVLCIGTEQLLDVKKEVGRFAEWKDLGLHLGLSVESLEVIERDYRWTKDQLEAVLLQWLRRDYDLDKYGSPSWSGLANAVEPINRALAIRIRERHP